MIMRELRVLLFIGITIILASFKLAFGLGVEFSKFWKDARLSEERLFTLKTSDNGYHGLIDENELVVNVTPAIIAEGDLVCGFTVIKLHHSINTKEEITPFEAVVLDQDAGTAELRAQHFLNCEHKKSYQFELQAISCSGVYSQRVDVHVLVQDVNEYVPEWPESNVRVTMEEDQLIENIIKVEATDKDCSPKYGNICRYNLLRSQNHHQEPFEISNEGVIRNTAPLNYSLSHEYVLSVVAYDCGMKASPPLFVTVEVKPTCNTGWTGLAPSLIYIPGTGTQTLFPDASFTMCSAEETNCQMVDSVEAKIILETTHIGKGCDRDTYTLESQRQLCGANDKAINLLPDPNVPENSWAQNMIHDSGQLVDSSMIRLTGNQGYDVPQNVIANEGRFSVGESFFPGNKFTIATWLRHRPIYSDSKDGNIADRRDKRRKEHVICKADDHGKNRHHFALFVRNCKLVLLMRREKSKFQRQEGNVFQPAEWRWKLPQVCDDEWHHYAILVNFPLVDLVVDGEKWEPMETDLDGVYDGKNYTEVVDGNNFHSRRILDNPEIIDDWPIHSTDDIGTKITIGACWQGSEKTYRHHLEGYLAGLSYIPGVNEHVKVLRCLHQCAESLQVSSATVTSKEFNLPDYKDEMMDKKSSSVVAIRANSDPSDIASKLRRVGYLNNREFPMPGRRLVRLETQLNCAGSRKTIHLENILFDLDVVAMPNDKPNIRVTGSHNVTVKYDDFKKGVHIFTNLNILMENDGMLDRCTISVTPPLNPDHELIKVPDDLMDFDVTADGADIRGVQNVNNYKLLLSRIMYSNSKPAYYLNRQFKVSCSQLNGRFVSNEYIQTLTVMHPDTTDSLLTELANADHIPSDDDSTAVVDFDQTPMNAHRRLVGLPSVLLREPNVFAASGAATFPLNVEEDFVFGNPASHDNVTAIFVIVGVSLVGAILLMAIIRLRGVQKKSREELQAEIEMAWDDSALNITVNPLEDTGTIGKRQQQPHNNSGNRVSFQNGMERFATVASVAKVCGKANSNSVVSNVITSAAFTDDEVEESSSEDEDDNSFDDDELLEHEEDDDYDEVTSNDDEEEEKSECSAGVAAKVGRGHLEWDNDI